MHSSSAAVHSSQRYHGPSGADGPPHSLIPNLSVPMILCHHTTATSSLPNLTYSLVCVSPATLFCSSITPCFNFFKHGSSIPVFARKSGIAVFKATDQIYLLMAGGSMKSLLFFFFFNSKEAFHILKKDFEVFQLSLP